MIRAASSFERGEHLYEPRGTTLTQQEIDRQLEEAKKDAVVMQASPRREDWAGEFGWHTITGDENDWTCDPFTPGMTNHERSRIWERILGMYHGKIEAARARSLERDASSDHLAIRHADTGELSHVPPHHEDRIARKKLRDGRGMFRPA